MATRRNEVAVLSQGNPTAAENSRMLSLRMRRDLVVRPLTFHGQKYWSIKDPLSTRYFQLRDEEYFVLCRLKDGVSVESILGEFNQEFAPRKLKDEQLQRFLGMLMHQGLVVSATPGQSQQLLARRARQRRQQLLQRFTSILAIRFRGVDPERFLRWLYPKCRWMFAKAVVLACLLFVFAALTLLFAQYDSFQSKLPEFHAFFNSKNLLWIGAAIAISKVLHEFGHALACKHFGGECREMGVMVLVFTPCLYCNVSDAWLMANKWHRVAISAAGMYVELVLASLCTFLWWFSEPGTLHAICLNMMFVCSVSTVLFNGNPLLRYDGYYILSDIVEVPNLRQQSMSLVRRWLVMFFLGVEIGNQRMLPDRRRKLLACYAIAAVAYRLFVVAAILWFIHAVLEPHGLLIVVQLLAAMMIFGMFVVPFWKTIRFVASVIRNGQVKKLRLLLSSAVVAGTIWFVGFVPLPFNVKAPVVLQPQDAERVSVSKPGVLTAAKREGTSVTQGQIIAQLSDEQLAREIAQLVQERELIDQRIKQFKTRRARGEDVADVIPTLERKLSKVVATLASYSEEQRKLTLVAPKAGVVIAPRNQERFSHTDELQTWSGTPLDEDNVGSYMEYGTTLCMIGDPRKLEALVVIDQSDMEFVEVGQRVRLLLDQMPEEVVWGTIREIGESPLEVTPPELLAEGRVPSVPDERQLPRPVNASFQARVELDHHDRILVLRSTGQAKIQVERQSLGRRLMRYLGETFHFKL